jgi:formamidopyrimidine-DNA glycosylase
MPELPDVEIFKQYLDATALHQEIVQVDARSRQVLQVTAAQELQQGLQGRCFETTHRHGKHLFAGLDDGHWLWLHFGMTGDLAYFKHREDDPQYDRLLIDFTNGYHLAYVSQRKLGELALVESVEGFVKRKDLGPDALKDLDLDTFKALVDGRRMMVKSFLMDQQTLAGIGNVYSDEILFQAGVHPRTKVNHLAEDVVERVYHEIGAVLRTAIDCRAEPDRFPDDYLIPQRHPDGTCPGCGTPVQRVKVSGRSAYYCPNRQGESLA